MKRSKLTTTGVILALSLFSSARCLAADDDTTLAPEVLSHLFGKEKTDVVVERSKKAEEKVRQARLWDEHYGPAPDRPAFAVLRDAQRETQRNVEDAVASEAKQAEADLASEAKKVELARQGLWKEPVMASDQGPEATQKFMQTINATSGDGAITGGAKAAVKDARDNAKEAAKDAASDARESVRSATDPTTTIKDNCMHHP